jgi:lipopolysaccharide/colanic/teichoic acid biosynthesis glycosyltransferase
MIKRLVDVVASATGLLLLSPFLLLTALLIRLTSPGPALFRQQRIGRRFQPFLIYKFRTMVQDAPAKGPALTVGADPRITRIGRFLRKAKLDELPQLLNVFKGEMSLVGPRPEVPRYVELYHDDYAEILAVRPGITDIASLQFRNESELLAAAEDPEQEYCQRILPIKIRLAKEYLRRSSLLFDIQLIARTVWALILDPNRSRQDTGSPPHAANVSLGN